jgi:hypothetical protein
VCEITLVGNPPAAGGLDCLLFNLPTQGQ